MRGSKLLPILRSSFLIILLPDPSQYSSKLLNHDAYNMEALKEERTQAKTKVTLAARRLKGAIERRADFSCINTFLTELERAYGDFELCHDDYKTELTNQPHLAEQYGTVNGKNLVDYKLEVFDKYKEGVDLYNIYAESSETGSVTSSVQDNCGSQNDVEHVTSVPISFSGNFTESSPNGINTVMCNSVLTPPCTDLGVRSFPQSAHGRPQLAGYPHHVQGRPEAPGYSQVPEFIESQPQPLRHTQQQVFSHTQPLVCPPSVYGHPTVNTYPYSVNPTMWDTRVTNMTSFNGSPVESIPAGPARLSEPPHQSTELHTTKIAPQLPVQAISMMLLCTGVLLFKIIQILPTQQYI